MLQFLLTPLNEHFDDGFGVMGESFYTAAQELEAKEGKSFDPHQHLPIGFLYRHAIELFLKSIIIIFHRRLKAPFGEVPWNEKPHVLVGDRWKRMDQIHSIKNLSTYYLSLFETHREFLKANSKCDWSFPDEFDKWIATIEHHDAHSTYLRYPITKDFALDPAKSGIASIPIEKLVETIRGGTKTNLTLLMQNETGEAVAAYNPVDSLLDLQEALREAATLLSGCHIGLRVELCQGT